MLEPKINVQASSAPELIVMEMDCDEIDRCLLPPSAFRRPLAAPISNSVLPEGSPFLDQVDSMYNLLRKEPFIYR